MTAHASPATSSPPSATGRSSRSLRNTLIEPFAQIKLGVYIIILTCIFLTLAGWLFFHTFEAQYNHVMEIFGISDPSTRWEVKANDVFYENIYKLAALFALYILVLLAIIFRITHKYHGPLVSIERFADSILQGKYYSRVAIRKGDELKNLAQKLNTMAMALERKHGALVDQSGESMRRRKIDQGSPSPNDQGQAKPHKQKKR